MARYECDRCGACCRGHLLVEAYELDVRREPRLAAADIGEWTRGETAQTVMQELEQEGKCLIIAGGKGACSFLSEDNTCEIYPTRPNVCVAMDAGGEQCQEAREVDGLDALEPVAEWAHDGKDID
jgi:Fe-S-cluster containining protein